MNQLIAKIRQFTSADKCDLSAAEAKRIKQTLEKDYDDSIQTMTFYDLLNPDGRTYTADYAEFTGQKFPLPTKSEILSRLTPKNLKLYQKMEIQGLQPKLQITPIAFKIRTLAQKLDAKKAGMENTGNTYICEEIKDEELQYAPTSIKASPDGQEIQITGGLTKSQWIRKNAGLLIDIVPLKPEMSVDPKIQNAKDGTTINYNAFLAEKYAAETKKAGFTPMSYESYLLAQMQAIKAGAPLESINYSLLLDSNLKPPQHLACAGWNGVNVSLDKDISAIRDDSLRLRASVRV